MPFSYKNDEVEVGSTYIGFVSNVEAYGVFVQFGKHSGLCHKSSIPASISIAQLEKNRKVKVSVIAILADQKISLALLELLPIKNTQAIRMADGLIVGNNLKYSKNIENAINHGVAEINKVGKQYRNNTPATRAGYVAEPDSVATFNVEGAFKGSKISAERLASNKPMSPDIAVRDGSGKAVKEVSSKVYKNAEATTKAQRGYGKQDRLAPKDQVDEIKAFAKRKVASERAKGTPERQQVAKEYLEVADRTTDHIEHGGIKSKPRTRKETQKLAEKARDGKVVGNDIVGELGTRVKQGATQGAKSGAIGSAVVSTVTGTYQAINDVRNGNKQISEAVVDVGVEVVASAIDGTIKGAASGAATAAARVAAEKVSSQGLKRVLGGSGPAAAAIVAVEIAKHSIDFARGVKTADEFKKAAKGSVINGSASFIGAEIGFLIGGPVGALVGGIAGPWLVDAFGQDDRCIGLKSNLEQLLRQNSATGHDGAMTYHLEQLEHMLSALSASDAVLFPDRVLITESGHHASSEIVLVYRGKIYVADFKAWKGYLEFPEIMETKTVVEKGWIWDSTKEIQVQTGEFDTKHIVQSKKDQYGYSHRKPHRNPMPGLNQFVFHLKRNLVSTDRRWKHVRLEPLIVFPDNAVTLCDRMSQTGQFVMFSDFLKLMSSSESRPTPQWMLDGLSSIPTWDVLQDPIGNLYRGIIQTPQFEMTLNDGIINVPFDAVIKLEVKKADNVGQPDFVTVTLHNQQTLIGTIKTQEIILKRNSFTRAFLLNDLSLVCPVFTLFKNNSDSLQAHQQ